MSWQNFFSVFLIGAICFSVGATTYTDGIHTWTYETVSGGIKLAAGSTGKPCVSPVPSGTFTVPDTLNKKTVVALGVGAFTNCANLTRINLPASLKTVESHAFANCTKLETVSFAYATYVQLPFYSCVFRNCPVFTNFIVAAGNTAYVTEGGALYSADKTKLVRCPTGVDGLTIAETTTKINQYAFDNVALTTLRLPRNVVEISIYAFKYATHLDAFTVADDNPNFLAHDGLLFYKDGKTLYKCPPARTTLAFEQGITNVLACALYGCTALTSVRFPASLERLETEALDGASILQTLVFEGNVPDNFVAACNQLDHALCQQMTVYYDKRYAASWQSALAETNIGHSEPLKSKSTPFLIYVE